MNFPPFFCFFFIILLVRFLSSFIVQEHSRGVRDLRELIDDVSGLFAGGELPEEDKDALMRAFTDAYFTAKEKNSRFTPKKYRKD